MLLYFSGRALDDPLSPDYVPSLHMGFENTSLLSAENREKRHQRSRNRAQKKDDEMNVVHSVHSAAEALINLSTSSTTDVNMQTGPQENLTETINHSTGMHHSKLFCG